LPDKKRPQPTIKKWQASGFAAVIGKNHILIKFMPIGAIKVPWGKTMGMGAKKTFT